ncbi:DUF4350 domain-containing protein [Pyrococcus kukulkanii]|uniref:DUF4350 domain-containing protein n=1 Tax=Pyrococcus kukulkanii TaxID=1609559 RepID=UPI000831D28F|nr:DUF4350 domain-containing protein [Pyrococcus kukulkanii]
MKRAFYFTLLAIGIAMLIMPISIPVFLTNAEFSVFNVGWNGCSEFAKLLHKNGDIIPVFSPFNSYNLGDKKGTLIIIGPDMSYSQLEIREIKKFLDNGGTLILIDDFGTGNQILKGLNLSARFSSKMPKEVFYIKSPYFPVIVRIKDPKISANVSKVVLNMPSVIIGANGSMFTSKITLLGRNFREYPIMTELKYGKGKIILFSDPSVFINDMMKFNTGFVNVFVSLYVRYPVYIDEAHHSNMNFYQTGTLVIRRSLDREKAFYVTAFVGVIILFIESGLVFRTLEGILRITLKVSERLFGEEKESIQDIIKRLEEEGYDGRVLNRIVSEINRWSKWTEESS